MPEFVYDPTSDIPIVSIRGLRKRFGSHVVLDGIDLEITPGELVCFIGRSGCGKSTLLRCLNGLERLDGGEIEIARASLHPDANFETFERAARGIRKNCGMVFQDFRLFPHLTLLENVVRAQIIVKKTAREAATENALRLLTKVGLSDHEKKMPFQLSGGQSQRGAIARALALAPMVMLYDEPTSALDPELVDEVLQVMKALDQEGMTQLVVTHEMRFARDVADFVVYMENGKIVERAPPGELFTHPRDDRTRQFLRKYL